MSYFSYQNNTLHAENVSLSVLAEQYGTPLYVYSRQAIADGYLMFANALADHSHLICYAVKANSNLAVLNVLAALGAGFDVVSIGELKRVLAAGGKAKNCVFAGVGKTTAEIEQALAIGIKCFNVESAAELKRLATIAAQQGTKAAVSIRVNPNVDAKTHPYISTGLKDNKFGVDIDEAEVLYVAANKMPAIEVVGVDCHIGSQITESEPFMDALNKVLLLLTTLAAKGIEIKHLNLGGGIGIDYNGEKTIDINQYIAAIIDKTRHLNCEIILEPGRAIVGNTGVLLTRVEYLKQTAHKSFAVVDGAMNDLLRPSLYQGYHHINPVDENGGGIADVWDVVGPVCESADFLAKQRTLTLAEGDVLAVMSAGAYGFVMSSNYNTRPRVAEVMVDNDKAHLIRKREIVEDLFMHEYLIDDVN